MASFANINVSQGSVATYERCDGNFNNHLTTNLPRNLPVKFFLNRLRCDRIIVMHLWPHLLAHSVGSRKFVASAFDCLTVKKLESICIIVYRGKACIHVRVTPALLLSAFTVTFTAEHVA